MEKVYQYLRYSSEGQSQHSIERQDLITTGWINSRKATVVKKFVDEGHSARTFDRPDMKALMADIKLHYRSIDYIVVSELSRFSREAGDAINMVKKIQQDYNVKIVSAGRGQIYDVHDSNSFFLMGLEFLLGNSENLKRINDINGGIYTAKTTKGRWIRGGSAPYGYKKEGSLGTMRLVINEAEAAVVRYIFNEFVKGTSKYIIIANARAMGWYTKGNDALNTILKKPIYMGQQHVKAWKDNAGGLYPVTNVEPIITEELYYQAQHRLNYNPKQRTQVNDEFPLRGALKCHCGRFLTGANSRSRSGNYYGYYKCHGDGHSNNFSSKKLNGMVEDIFTNLSLPARLIPALKDKVCKSLEDDIKQVQLHVTAKKIAIERTEQKIENLEDKWLSNTIAVDTYQTWFPKLKEQRLKLTAELQELQRSVTDDHLNLITQIDCVTDMNYFYRVAATTDKHQLLNMVFDKSLYFREGICRTAFLLPFLRHNELILKEKRLLEIDAFGGKSRWVDP